MIREKLAARDAVFVYDETDRHLSNMVVAYVFEPPAGAEPLAADRVVAWLQARLGHSEIFRRRLRRTPYDLDLPYWVTDPDGGTTGHIHVEQPASSSWDEACRRICEIAADRFDLSESPWAIHVMTSVRGAPHRSGAVTLVVLKLHHSVCDGVAIRELELALFGSAEAPVHPRVPVSGWRVPELVRTVGAAGLGAVRFATGLARTAAAQREVDARIGAGRIREPIADRPATRFNRDVTGTPVVGTAILPLGELLAARKAAPEKVTVNDMVLAVIGGALVSYLGKHDELPAGSLAAMVPISMRRNVQWESANRLCQMFVDLHTDIDDPVQRLLAIRQSARWEKERAADSAVLRREARVESSPAWMLRLAGWARAQRSFADTDRVPYVNTSVSNVVPQSSGPGGPAIDGHPMTRVHGVLPLVDGDGLRHVVTSQCDELVIAFHTTDTLLPDTGHYSDLLLDSFRRLERELSAG